MTVICPSCEADVSQTAAACPRCGHRFKGSSPVVVLLAAGVLGLLVVAGVGMLGFVSFKRQRVMMEEARRAEMAARHRMEQARAAEERAQAERDLRAAELARKEVAQARRDRPGSAGARARLERAPRGKLVDALLEELDEATLKKVLRRVDGGD